ncbi:hypothetical protein CE91St24_06290 [Odoribacteraceae bacterium]|uniref:TlpA family protein disulfide reductase n=2 Tax=Odoribacteraceae TaxID=1853231 RepID=UPI00208AB80C|nr:TlpA disulfide reductase family protein [Butyricimonas paravirosa]BDF56363.1 hypothetical protein CE91St21_37980 [Odoribacteraceae bacterium]GKH95227.1 hypothetical protein CE91St23_37230 [Odoribacteraceae bacterium]GKH97851.1 hypothetical protein CE91St22_17290 [Odoribacteraceae bacterium]GKI01354.1 hypothetical protein CE91St24_06290 [Odoribacteraceae bacterium]
MKITIIRIIFLVFWTAFLSGCQSRQAALTFKTYATNANEARLELNGNTWTVPYDSLQGAVFKLQDINPGYAHLRLGNFQKILYIEPGTDLIVTYQRPGKSRTRTSFEGKGAAENTHLDTPTQLVSLQQDMTGEMVQKLLLDSVQTRQARLEASSLSPAFKALERERQRYQVMRQAFKYQHWTTEDVPFIEKQIKEQPELLPTEEYSAFLREALSFIAWFQVSERTYYPLAKAQMEYLNTHFRDTAIVDFLMESVLTNYMTYRGATDITPMLNIFNQRVTSPTLREKIKRDYEKYARILRGASVPDFTFIDTKGKEVKLSSFKGKYVYIDCWASWCGPCRAQIPHLKKLEHDYAGKDIAFVSISSDDNRDKWKKTVEKEQLGGTQLIIQCATNNEFADYFIITGIPRFLLLDKEGKVYDAYAPRPSEPAIRQLFDSLP